MVTSQLASNAFGRVVPGGVAAAGAMQYAMLTRAGVPAGSAASGMTASSVLVFGILLALPLLALPAVLFGAPVDPGLGKAALIGGRDVRAAVRRRRRGDPVGPPAGAGRPGGADGAQPHPPQQAAADRGCPTGCCASATA